MADIVLHGLGDGPYVTNGLGHTTPPPPGVMAAYVAGGASIAATLTADGGTGTFADMAATVNGTATLTATLSDGVVADPNVGSIARLGGWRPEPPKASVFADMSAAVVGAATVTADLTFTDNTEALLMLLDLDLMLTEGVHL